MGLFTKKRNVGMWMMIDFTPEAKKWAVGNSRNKRIYKFYNKSLIGVENYSTVKQKMYQKQGSFIWDKTQGQDKPMDAVEVPVIKQVLSSIELYRRLA